MDKEIPERLLKEIKKIETKKVENYDSPFNITGMNNDSPPSDIDNEFFQEYVDFYKEKGRIPFKKSNERSVYYVYDIIRYLYNINKLTKKAEKKVLSVDPNFFIHDYYNGHLEEYIMFYRKNKRHPFDDDFEKQKKSTDKDEKRFYYFRNKMILEKDKIDNHVKKSLLKEDPFFFGSG